MEAHVRVAILSLFLCAATGFCQSSVPAPTTTENLALAPLLPAPPADRDFSKLPPGWRPKPLLASKTMMVSKSAQANRMDNMEIDRQIVVHPPQASIGAQPPGTAVTQNRYPGLRILPIDSIEYALETIPALSSR
jgi:hypothetical protein